MRQELDSSNTVLFPEEIFGKAKQSNAERMVAIAESFASQGARQEDPGHGINNPMNNRWLNNMIVQCTMDSIQGCRGLE